MTTSQQYREIRRVEFEAFLESICDFAEYTDEFYEFDFVEESTGKWRRVESTINEFCYFVAVNLDRGFCLKIYSSIERDNRISRGSGEDAIRVVAADANTAKPLRGPFPKVKRIKNWRKNLHRRMSAATQSLGINTECPLCSNLLLFRKKKADGHVFLGCSQYPDCKGYRNL